MSRIKDYALIRLRGYRPDDPRVSHVVNRLMLPLVSDEIERELTSLSPEERRAFKVLYLKTQTEGARTFLSNCNMLRSSERRSRPKKAK